MSELTRSNIDKKIGELTAAEQSEITLLAIDLLDHKDEAKEWNDVLLKLVCVVIKPASEEEEGEYVFDRYSEQYYFRPKQKAAADQA